MFALVKNTIHREDSSIVERKMPELKDGQSLLKVINVGICGSDLHMYYGDESYEWIDFPLVLGHEIVGEITESSNSQLLNKKVIIDPYTPCGKCTYCLSGRVNLCDNNNFFVNKSAPISLSYGFREDGGMSEYMAVNNENCIVIDEMDLGVAGICESIAVGFHAIKKINYLKESKNKPIIIFGPGPIGLGILSVLNGLGFQNITIVGTEKDKYRLLKAKELGANFTYYSDENLRKALLDNNSSGYDVVFETSGHPSTIDITTDVLAKGGDIILVGISNSEVKIPMDQMVRGEMNIKGSYGINRDSLIKVIEFSKNESFKFSKLVDGIYSYQDYDEAFKRMRSGEICKLLLNFE